MTYDEFLGRYGEMIDGKVQGRDERALSSNSRPVTGHPEEEGKSEHNASEKRRRENKSSMSKGSNSRTNTANNTKDGFDLKDELKYEIPESCYQVIMKGNKIAKLDKKFKLCTHPFPILEGELIIFQTLKQD
jgi:hypothetical protein